MIGASDGPGLLYGTMSLRQMLRNPRKTNVLPAVAMHDWPAIKMRGIQDEFSYGQVSTMDNFKDIIRFPRRIQDEHRVLLFRGYVSLQKISHDRRRPRGHDPRRGQGAAGVCQAVQRPDHPYLRDAGEPGGLVAARRGAPVRRVSRCAVVFGRRRCVRVSFQLLRRIGRHVRIAVLPRRVGRVVGPGIRQVGGSR